MRDRIEMALIFLTTFCETTIESFDYLLQVFRPLRRYLFRHFISVTDLRLLWLNLYLNFGKQQNSLS